MMMSQHLRNIALSLELFALLTQAAFLNYTGEAITTRYWDCCKPSCGWNGKADFSSPVESCTADDKPTDAASGTGCNGGTAFSCSGQQPWAINDTVAYGFAGAFIEPSLTHGGIEDAWCCACYQLTFTSEPLIGKSMIVQASNTAYDVTATNRFSLAIPGGNTTSTNACAKQYGVDQSVFGQNMEGVRSLDDCENLPENLRAGCQFRFDWFKDASYPSANFKRVVCPAEITAKTGCIRNDDQVLARGGQVSAAQSLTSPSSTSTMALFAAIILGLISI
ncbi:endoglucanase 1 precursor [Pyrenophora tritici-repentis]|uniref:Cellulase n=1 Tax=Pyrenophora tritici-repentis (strain Pt-1C-BFP) TaxID=426418 RepID=B2W7A0_PYRTR|nr:endoglucanase 1 precursor [Pyrenophora tritici-repentis Pt-1C-BFP]KAI0586634.1 Endoglucanase 1 [Pyrenophora tritici-repentis]EDU48608.1 endoglucanase 1 precursor [Pyrenophora tritici-repentis Pt-1C-BFP]KAI1545328.1 endoglucanase 1 precursor [Pyrenophora tritici-repentis]KAI1548389.1 hypothetical protein PtrSN001C_002089 [Pyrenophora tritici-repentis]KAI1556548.1 endoglucanase 1 precursor [Pyrenophora tritici-repentis]